MAIAQARAGSSSPEGDGDKAENQSPRLVLAAPKDQLIDFGAWSPSAEDGRTPNWVYFVTFRVAPSRTDWEGGGGPQNNIYFFREGNLEKNIDLPWKPCTNKRRGEADERTILSLRAGSEYIGFDHVVYAPDQSDVRYPKITEAKVLNHSGDLVISGKRVRSVSSTGRSGAYDFTFVNLLTGDTHEERGSVEFSRYDDSYIAFPRSKTGGSVEYHAPDGHMLWSISLTGYLRMAVIAPKGGGVFLIEGDQPQQDLAEMVDSTGNVLWKTPVHLGQYAASFSPEGRLLGFVTRDANWLVETNSGKLLAKIPMSAALGGEKQIVLNPMLYVDSGQQLVSVLARSAPTSGSNQDLQSYPFTGQGPDLVYEYGPKYAKAIVRLPPSSFRVAANGFGSEPMATISPSGRWLYFLNRNGLFTLKLR